MPKSSLFSEHPWRVDVPVLIFGAIITLYFGLTEPVVRLSSAIQQDSDYSIAGGIWQFLQSGDYLIEFDRWVMTDVFALALFVAIVRLANWTSIEPRAGLYCFAGAIVI